MKTEDFKIYESDFAGKGVSAQPNPMEKSEDEAKAVFDELVKEVVTPKFNAFVEAFKDVDLTADQDKPVSDAVQTALDGKVDKEEGRGLSKNDYTDEEKKKVSDAAGKMHEHENAEVLDGIRQQDVDNWNGGNVLTKDNAAAWTPTGQYQPATKKYVDDKVVAAGAADMTQAVYDPRGKRKDIFQYVDDAVEDAMGNIPTPDVSGQISSHNTDKNAHRGMFAEADHSHTAAEVGAAKAVHSHGLADVGISYGTEDLEAGVSELPTGTVYLVYTM